MVVPQRKAGGRLFARRCTDGKVPCRQIAAAIFPKTALVTPHAAVVDLDHIPRWCGSLVKGNKMHIVVAQFCPRKQWTDGHTPAPRSIGEHDGAGHRRRSSLLRGKIKK